MSSAGEAQDVVATIGEDINLDEIAQHLPKPEDLLENADEAPIIRLINALLAEAVKENASDIHIEPTRIACPCDYGWMVSCVMCWSLNAPWHPC